MLSREDNKLLCRVGPGTPMGQLLREYWLPFLKSSDVERGGQPLRVKLLSEDLVAFRDTSGRVGLHTRAIPVGSEELAEGLAPFMSHCIEQFGPERCMFESNFPVDKVSYSYNVLFNAFKRLSAGYSAPERAAMFHDTAARVYGVGEAG